MEIMGVMKAIEWLKSHNIKQGTIFSDSMYVIGTLTKNWRRKKNVDLWDKMDEVLDGMCITYKHVKGHNGDSLNEYCDALAVLGKED